MKKGVSIAIGIIAAVVVVAVVVVVVVVVVLGGGINIDTSPITEVTEKKAVTKTLDQDIYITDEYYYLKEKVGDGETAKYTFDLTYMGGETKQFVFQNDANKNFRSLVSDRTAIYEITVETGRKYGIINPFQADIAAGTITNGSEEIIKTEQDDEIVTLDSTNGIGTYRFYYRDGDNNFTKSSFTIAFKDDNTGTETTIVSFSNKFYGYFVYMSEDVTNEKRPKTYSLYNASGSGVYEAASKDENLKYVLDNDSTVNTPKFWLDAKMLQNTKDTKTYFLTEFFGTEQAWTSTVPVATDYQVTTPILTARSWTVKHVVQGAQSKEKPDSVLLHSWVDGKNSYTFTNVDTKLLISVQIPFLAKWAIVEYYADTYVYEVVTFNSS